jgi:lipoprotein-anchoring transpeptidase ErfK/SrfK
MKKFKLKSSTQHYFELILKRAGGAVFSFVLIFSTGAWVLGVMHMTSNQSNQISDGTFRRNEVLSARETINLGILSNPNGAQMFNCPTNTPIKGIIEPQGKMIYLEPQNPQYLYTKPDSCFSSMEQAQNEGYESHPKNLATSNINNEPIEIQKPEVLGVLENKNIILESVSQNLETENNQTTPNPAEADLNTSKLPDDQSLDQMLERSNQTKIIVVNLTDQTLKTMHNGAIESETKITSGKKDFETPTGQFKIINKARNARLKAPSPRFGDYDLKVQYWLGFGNGYGFHDAYWRSSFGGEDRVSNGSHGCINMPLEAVKSLYTWAEVGTEVYII